MKGLLQKTYWKIEIFTGIDLRDFRLPPRYKWDLHYFWDIIQRRMLFLNRRFGTIYRSYFKGSSSPRKMTASPSKMEPIRCSKTSARNHPSVLRKIPNISDLRCKVFYPHKYKVFLLYKCNLFTIVISGGSSIMWCSVTKLKNIIFHKEEKQFLLLPALRKYIGSAAGNEGLRTVSIEPLSIKSFRWPGDHWTWRSKRYINRQTTYKTNILRVPYRMNNTPSTHKQ